MRHSALVFSAAALLAALGLPSPAMAQGKLPSASSTDNDPVLAPEDTTTTTSVGNPDGSRTVTTTDADGNVVEQHTVPGESGPRPSTLEEIEAEIERRAQEDDLPDADAPGTDAPDAGESESAVPPPTTDWERADDELIDMEEQIRDLRYRHNELLDQAAQTEDPEAFQRLVDEAQQVFQEMKDLQDAYEDRRAQGDGFADEELEYVDVSARGAEIERLEERLEELPGEIDEAETDEEAEALEEEAAEAARRLQELQEEHDQGVNETREDAIRRAAERHLRATGHQGTMQNPQIPTPTPPMNPQIMNPQIPVGRPQRPGY